MNFANTLTFQEVVEQQNKISTKCAFGGEREELLILT